MMTYFQVKQQRESFKGSRVKLQVGLCKGKKLHDKRDSIAARDAKRTIDRAIKERNR